MSTEAFVYWLQGFVELHGHQPTPEQWKMIKDHLQTVFHKVTPSVLSVPVSPAPWEKDPYQPFGPTWTPSNPWYYDHQIIC